MDLLIKRLKDLETEIKNKVDCDVYDNEIASIREMIGNIDEGAKPSATIATSAPVLKPSGPQLSTKDLNRIKEILEKFPSVEET